MRRLALAAGIALLHAHVAACTLLRPLDGLTCEPGAANASCRYGQACDGDADCTTASCNAGACQCPDDMVTIDSAYCVDRTEVSNAAYRKFLDGAPDTGAQGAACGWNATFAFDDGADAPEECRTLRHREDDYPATCIDWCDARAFCQSLGKHLCGRIHGDKIDVSAYADPAQSEWFNACSRGGALAFSTGELDPQCNGDRDGPAPVGGRGAEICEGGYPGLEHLSGNVREWENACSGDTGPGDECLTRGGAFDEGGGETLRCDALDPRARDDTYYAIGFRCCSG